MNLREVVNGLLYVLGTGCQGRAIPKDLPPCSTLHGYFMRWEWDGTRGRIGNPNPAKDHRGGRPGRFANTPLGERESFAGFLSCATSTSIS